MHVTRFVMAIVAACVLALGLSGVVSADSTTGQTANYIFNDSSGSPGAVCRYSEGSIGIWKIYRIVGVAPDAWWYDTDSNNNTQHGPVGWQLTVRHKSPAGSTWLLVGRSSIQHKTAYEGYPGAYDLADSAPFTNMSVSFNGGAYPTTEQFRAVAKVMWFRKDGTVKGSATHVVQYYRLNLGGFNGGTAIDPFCVRRIAE